MKYPRGVEIAGSAIVENEKGEVLMVKSPKWSNKWVFPGGHVEPGETIMDTQVKEVEEETGLKVVGVDIVSYGELINSKDFYRPAHFIYFDVYCKYQGGEVKLDNKEVTEYKWVKPEEALKMGLAATYDKTIEEFIRYKKLR